VTKARIDRDSDSDSEDENLEVLELAGDRSNLDRSSPSSEDKSTDIHQKEHVESQPTSLPEVGVSTTVTEFTKAMEANRNKTPGHLLLLPQSMPIREAQQGRLQNSKMITYCNEHQMNHTLLICTRRQLILQTQISG